MDTVETAVMASVTTRACSIVVFMNSSFSCVVIGMLRVDGSPRGSNAGCRTARHRSAPAGTCTRLTRRKAVARIIVASRKRSLRGTEAVPLRAFAIRSTVAAARIANLATMHRGSTGKPSFLAPSRGKEAVARTAKSENRCLPTQSTSTRGSRSAHARMAAILVVTGRRHA